MINPSKYPFLVPIEKVLKDQGGISIFDIISVDGDSLKSAKERISLIIENKRPIPSYNSYRNPNLVFYSLLLILSVLYDRRLMKRIIQEESEMFVAELKKESEDDLLSMASYLGVKVERREISYWEKNRKKILSFTLPFLNYIRDLPKNIEDLRLCNQIVKDGYVYIDKVRLVELLKTKIQEKILSLVKPISLSKIPDSIRDILSLKGGKTPPCIEVIMRKKERNPEEVRTLVVYMIDIGIDRSTISSTIKDNIENPDEFIDSFLKRKEKFIIYSCKKMKELGLCIDDCNVKNPLQLYFGRAERTS
ncbi:DNA primase regulatory subunit PriL [Acidianus sp. RZ1]|uniref:DNA primase regulatory subunit PriL n=1 Tax=Acidianus sp. RZ1 TaxID=1540082 RepID=UPI0014924684|nr:DNA primase regulatory subunit PriL [Acidianus sp. RZ1]NON61872.1 DNA primase regulatory subunit PriL [Acidianus sp. RZ1]